ncbi:MAG: MBL fold metallo-hydrolase [Patescibacteria group bacterium]|nr:MBL fold metallo-hydrolase [Patescibacteria group bacterium]
MQIIWYGESCFKIITNELSILTDPFSPAAQGLKNPRLTSEIVVFSNPATLKKKEEEKNNFFLISMPGEYEIKNIFIFSLPHQENNLLKLIYKIETEEIKICFWGEISKEPASEELEKLGEVDVLLISFAPSLSLKEIVKTIKEIQPKIVIPHSLKIKENKIDLKIIEKFTQEMGWRKFEKTAKLKIRKKDLSLGKTGLIILEPVVN